MRSRGWFRRVVLGVAVVLMAAACGDDDSTDAADQSTNATESPSDVTQAPADATDSTAPPGTSETTAAAETTVDDSEAPVSGGTVSYALLAENVPDLFPDTPPTVSFFTVAYLMIYDALVVEDNAEVTNRLAESFESGDGGTTWTLALHDGITFSDGTPLDAEAVKFNWERTAAPESVAFSAAVARSISSITVVDPLTLELTLAAPDPQFNRTVANGALTFIGSPKALQEKGAAFGTDPVGAGAFVLEEWVPGTSMVLARSDSYYGEPAYLDKVQVVYIPDDAQRYTTFSSGGANMMLTTNPTIAARGTDEDFGRMDSIANGGTVVTMNLTAPPFDDIRARQALSYAIDRHAMSERLYEGASVPADNLFAEESPFYDPAYDLVAPDPAEAQRLLDELAAEGKPLSFTIICADAFAARAEFIQAQLASYDNINVEVQVLGGAEFTELTSPGSLNYQAGMSIVQFADPGRLNRSVITGGDNNRAGYSNPEMDAALAAGIATSDTAERKTSYDTVQELLLEDLPYIWLDRSLSSLLVDEKVQNVEYVANLMIEFDRMWLST